MAGELRPLIDEVQVVRAMHGRRPAEPASVAQRGVERLRIPVASLLAQRGDRRVELLDERHEIDDRLGGHAGHSRRADVVDLRPR
jgi:hypothetical protein